MEINIEQIKETIALGESESVEFKTSFNDEGLETIGAFSNANGGKLIVGVNDFGIPNGLQLGKKTIEDIANRIQAVTDPRLQPSIKNCQLEDNVIIIIQVSQNSGIPVSVRGRYFKRVGKTNQRMSHDEIMQRLILGTGKSWDLYSVTNSTLSDINLDLLDNFIHSSNKLGRKNIPEFTPKDSLLRKLDLIRDGNLSRAALLLFGTNISANFPSAFVKVGKFRSLTTIVDDREFSGSLIQQLDNIMIWFKDRLTTEFIITGTPKREVRWEYPLSAIREAVINMLCHRDYSDGAHSQIRLYDDRLEFWNSGSLPSSLTPESLLAEHDSIPRNPKIADVFFYMGLIERWGSGTVRISEELKKAGLPEPEFISEFGKFKLIFYKQALYNKQLEKYDLSARQLKAIEYVKIQGTISNAEYQKITGISKSTASKELSELLVKEILVSTVSASRGRGKAYKLKE